MWPKAVFSESFTSLFTGSLGFGQATTRPEEDPWGCPSCGLISCSLSLDPTSGQLPGRVTRAYKGPPARPKALLSPS